MRRFSMYRRGRKRGERVRPRAGRRRLPHWAARSMLAHRPRCNPWQRARPLVARDIWARTPSQAPARALSKGTGASGGWGSRHNAPRAVVALGIGLPSASAGICGGLAAGFTDGDAAPPAVGLGVLCPSHPSTIAGAPYAGRASRLDSFAGHRLCLLRRPRRPPSITAPPPAPRERPLPRHALVHGDRGHAEGQGRPPGRACRST